MTFIYDPAIAALVGTILLLLASVAQIITRWDLHDS